MKRAAVNLGAQPGDVNTALSAELEAPRSILLFERIHYGWLHPELITRLQSEYGTTFTILSPKNATAAERKSDINELGELLYIEDVDAEAERSNGADWAAVAARNESRYGICYMRDIIQQDRWASSDFVGYASSSYFASRRPADFDAIYRRINSYVAQIEAVFDRRAIDCVIGWPSYSMLTAVATHVALKRQIPVTFLAPGRRDFRLMWSDGPYVGPRLVDKAMQEVVLSDRTPPDRQPPADTQAAIADLQNEFRFRTHAARMFSLSRDHAIWAVTDTLRREPGRRSPYLANMKRIWRDWRMMRALGAKSEKSVARIMERPYIFFPLPYEPEFPNTSLAREFNDTLCFVKQCAISLPAGHRLVVKEHVVGVGHRPAHFLQEILRLPNTILADNAIRGLDLVARSAAVATLNGTAGLEAAYFGKKALLFSKNVEYAGMPHVVYVKDIRDLPLLMRNAVNSDERAFILESAARHHSAIEHLAVDVSKIDVFGGTDPRLPKSEYAKLVSRLIEAFSYLKQLPTAQT